MQFGSDTWDENDNTEALNNALFRGLKKNSVKNNTPKKKKTAKQIDQETKQAKEFLQTFKTVQKTQKIVQFDVSDGESDSGDDLSKRAKKNLKERNRKKRKKELNRKEKVKKRKENLDSDEELFAQIDDEDDRKEPKIIPEKLPKIKKTNDVQIPEKPKKVKNPQKEKIKKKICMEMEKLPKDIDTNKNEKVVNPFQCETKNLTKKQKKKLKKKANQEKLALEMKSTKEKTKNISGKKCEPLNKKSKSEVNDEGSEGKPLKKKKSKVKALPKNDVSGDKEVNDSNKVADIKLGSEGKSLKKKKPKVNGDVSSAIEVNNSNKVTETEIELGSEGKPLKKKKSKMNGDVSSAIEVNNSNKVTETEIKLGSEKPLKEKKSKVNREKKIDNNTVTTKKMANGDSSNISKVKNSAFIDTVLKSKKKRKNSENGDEVKIPEKKPKIDSDFKQKGGKCIQKNKVAASLKNEKPSKTSEKAGKFDTKKLSNILANKNSGVQKSGGVQTHEKKLKPENKDSKNKKGTKSLQERMKSQLNEARFRFLNEQLYTQTGPQAFSMFQEDQESFKVYHEGFQSQVSKWPVNPLDIIINQVKKLPKTHVIADFGCGNADLAQSVPQKVHSFDLVPLNKYVTVCDISKVPLPTKSVDVAVFCLSLMGTNLNDYVAEANRVLQPGGELKIAEVESRIADTKSFISQIESFGFKLLDKETSHKMFHLFYFNKTKPCMKSAAHDVQLDPCVYKRR